MYSITYYQIKLWVKKYLLNLRAHQKKILKNHFFFKKIVLRQFSQRQEERCTFLPWNHKNFQTRVRYTKTSTYNRTCTCSIPNEYVQSIVHVHVRFLTSTYTYCTCKCLILKTIIILYFCSRHETSKSKMSISSHRNGQYVLSFYRPNPTNPTLN